MMTPSPLGKRSLGDSFDLYENHKREFEKLKELYRDDGGRVEKNLPLHLEIYVFLYRFYQKVNLEDKEGSEFAGTYDLESEMNQFKLSIKNLEQRYLQYQYLNRFFRKKMTVRSHLKWELFWCFERLDAFQSHYQRLKDDSEIPFSDDFEGLFETVLERNGVERILNLFECLNEIDEQETNQVRCLWEVLTDERYVLQGVNKEALTELFGWINDSQIPIFNTYSYRSMLALDFEIQTNHLSKL